MTFKKKTDEHGDWLCTDTRKWPIMTWHEGDNEGDPGLPYSEFHLRVAHLLVESGWEISVIWSTGTYSDNHYADLMGPTHEFKPEPNCVEVGLWHRDGKMMGDPAGWVNQEDFAAFMDLINTLPCDWSGELKALIELEQPRSNHE